ncbi:MAG: hypothetical protein HOP16_04940 [Acidobacteria bacterium]|nr:hypothetical protein [Acidobacteriota bacterium]
MRRILLLLPAAVVAATIVQGLSEPVAAHHSEAPFYDSDKVVEISGKVTSWVFRNPHPFLHIDVVDEKGVTNDWALEFVGPVRLIKVGWSAKTFVPGEVVSAKGHPSRAPGTFGLSPLSVSRADGKVIPGSGRGGSFAPEAGQQP